MSAKQKTDVMVARLGYDAAVQPALDALSGALRRFRELGGKVASIPTQIGTLMSEARKLDEQQAVLELQGENEAAAELSARRAEIALDIERLRRQQRALPAAHRAIVEEVVQRDDELRRAHADATAELKAAAEARLVAAAQELVSAHELLAALRLDWLPPRIEMNVRHPGTGELLNQVLTPTAADTALITAMRPTLEAIRRSERANATPTPMAPAA